MKLFLDTAIIKEIEWAEERGLLDGVTTNPTLLNKTDRKLSEVIQDILSLIDDRPVGIQLVSAEFEEIINEAKTVAKLAKNVVVKVPVTDEGLRAIKQLSTRGVKTMATLVCSANQALLAARAGATYVSVFVGRLDDSGKKGLTVLKEVVDIFRQYEFSTAVVAASIRSARQVEEAALLGVDVTTVPYKVLIQMFRHELTDKGVKKFEEDWDKLPK